jgi:hypothetical protein
MCGRKRYKRFAGVGVAIVLLAGVGIAVGLFVGRARFASLSPRPVDTGGPRAATPAVDDLVAAIRNGDARAVRKLLDTGADVNARDAEGNTPLILAAFYASPECLELLIEKGADVNAANKAGATPLIRAATDHEKTRLLVAAGANVRVRTARGNTPLILAARRAGNAPTAALLLERGADPTERNDAGVGPVLSAAAIRMDWLQPGIAPTVKRVEVPMVAIVQFEGDKVANEHIYWDQASLLVQVGLLDRTLPVRGGEIAAQVLNPTQPMNELIRRAPNPTPWAER